MGGISGRNQARYFSVYPGMKRTIMILMTAFALASVSGISAEPAKPVKQTKQDLRAEKARHQLEEDLRLRGSMIPWKHARR